MKRLVQIFFIATAVVLLLTAGCRTEMPKSTINIHEPYKSKMTEKMSKSGLRAGWINAEAIKKYKNIWIECQLSSPMYQNSWFDNFYVRRLFYSAPEDNRYVEGYMEEQFSKALTSSSEFLPAQEAGKGTMKLNLYITQIVANKIIIGTLSNILYPTPLILIIIPVRMIFESAMDSQGGAIAIEAVLTDSQTGEVLGVFASREKGPAAIFDSNRFFAYSNVRNIINIWAEDMVYMLGQMKQGVENPIPPKEVPTIKILRFFAD